MAVSKYPTPEPLYALAQALERRYPGVRVYCELYRFEDGRERAIYKFVAPHPEVLIGLDLATRPGTRLYGLEELRAPHHHGVETKVHGYVLDDHAYVVYITDDGTPNVGTGRTFPLKKTQQEFERIWKRISALRRPSAASAGGDSHGCD